MANKSRNNGQVQGSFMSTPSLEEKDSANKVSNPGPKIAAKKRDHWGQRKPQMTPFMEFMNKHGIRKEPKDV